MKVGNLINVIDIEATCWDYPAPEKIATTIEIGITVVEMDTIKINNSTSVYISVDSDQISSFCTQLTGITPELIAAEGIPFMEAINLLKRTHRIHNRPWISWGDYDINQLRRDCEKNNLIYEKVFYPRHANLKLWFSLMYGLTKELSVGKALEYINSPFEGSPHSGKDDAYNIAKIFKRIREDFKNVVLI